jgi:hypothetical protein
MVARLLGEQPSRRQAGRRRDWQQVQDALQRLEGVRERARDLNRHRDDPAASRARRAGREDRARGREER